MSYGYPPGGWQSGAWNRVFDFTQFPVEEPFTASVEQRAAVIKGSDPMPTRDNLPPGFAPDADPIGRAVAGAVAGAVGGPVGAMTADALGRIPNPADVVRNAAQTYALYGLGVLLVVVGVAALVWNNRETVVKVAGTAAQAVAV